MATLIDVSSFDRANENKCHLVPCKIKYNGNAKVSEYFCSSIRRKRNDDGSEQLTASMRGRPLNGEEMKIPQGYIGVVLKGDRKPVTEDEDRNLIVTGKFKNMTYWNLDKVISADDKFRQALDWIDIAKELEQLLDLTTAEYVNRLKKLHRPVDEESSQISVTGK